MSKRIVAALLVLLLAGNGLVMLLASIWWYGAVPGVTGTGPFNLHFVRDIGAAYLVCGMALGWYAARPAEARPAVMGAAAFLLLHVLIHVVDAFFPELCGRTASGGLADVLRDFPGVYLPALLAAWIAAGKPQGA
jgi:hypothetical protein